MNITREDMPGRQIALTIELDPETVNGALDRAYRQMVNQVNIPGFRRGKAPRAILERYVGLEQLTERAVRNILPKAVQDAISEQNIEALDISEAEIVNLNPIQVKVVVVQPPIVELGDYSGVRVERDAVEVTPEQVDEVVTELRRESAPWQEPTEARPIEKGDMVYLDLEGFTTEGALEAAARDNFPTIVGVSRAGVPEMVNAALEGLSVGDEKDVADTLPEDYPNEELRGKDVTYHVTVRQIKSQELPELTDEFAKTLNFDTVDALREGVEKNLRQRADEAAESKQINAAMEQIIGASTVEVPDMMVNEELGDMLKSLEARLKEQRLTLRQYFTYNGVTEADWREANRSRAQERVVNNLVLQEFAARENLNVTDEEVDAEITDLLNSVEGDERTQAEQMLSRHEARHDVQDRVFNRKLVERLSGIASGTIEAQPAPQNESVEDTEGEEAATEAENAVNPADTVDTAEASVEPAGDAENTAEGEDSSDAEVTEGIEGAAGAAEVLNSEELISPNETGTAPAGGTPNTAPGL